MDTHPSPEAQHFPPIHRIILWCLLTILAFFLITEHAAHLFGILPYLLLLACPLMHLFLHGRHGGHGHPSDPQDTTGQSHEGGQ